MRDLKNETNSITNRLAGIENRLVVTSGEREGGEGQDRGRGLRGTNYYV